MVAEAAILGLPVDRLLRTSDPDERRLLDAARIEGGHLMDDLMTTLARKIVNEYVAAVERGRKRSR